MIRFRLAPAVLLLLLPALLPPAVAAADFAPYLQGGAGAFQCFPPVDRSPCPDDSGLDEAAAAVVAVYRACAEMTRDPGTQQKYAVIGQYMAQGPHGLALVAAYAAAEGQQDLLKCTLKGLNRTSDGSEHQKAVVEKAIDGFFTARDWKGSAQNLYSLLHLDPDSISAATEAYAFTERAGELTQFDSLLRSAGEVIGGPHARAGNRLADVDELIRRCDFDLAGTALSNAALAADHYCTAGGVYYRKMEKSLRCYRSDHYKQVVEMFDTPQQHQYHSDRRQLEREADTLSRGLGILQQVRDKGEELRTAREYFSNMQRDYRRERQRIDDQLGAGHLHDACQSINKLRLAEQWAGERSARCLTALGEDYAGQARRLRQHNRIRALKLTLLLDGAGQAIDSCALDKAASNLDAVQAPLDDLWEVGDGGCSRPLQGDRLAERLAELRNKLQQARAGDDCRRLSSDCPLPAGAVQRRSTDPYPGAPQTYVFHILKDHRVGPYFKWFGEQGSQLAERGCYDEQGRLTGTRSQWRADGTLYEQGHYLADQRNGTYTLYNDLGKPREQAEYRNGRKHGKETVWYENGQRSRERHYVDGKLDGLGLHWNIRGELLDERHYRNGREHGIGIDYKDGRVYWKMIYRDGVLERYLIRRGKPVTPGQ